MRVRRIGSGTEFRLIQDEQEIGCVDQNAVRFHGFGTRMDAALAASLAHRALTDRRGEAAHPAGDPADILIVNHESTDLVVAQSGVVARLLPPVIPESGWGFELDLFPEEAFEVFAIGRARLMWRAIQGTSMSRRMLQFQNQHRASVLAPKTNRVSQ
jgi:hypothetical protein